MSYQITEEQKKILLQYSAQTLPDNPSRDGFSAETIRKRMYKPTEKLVDLVNAVFDTVYTDVQSILSDIQNGDFFARSVASWSASYTYGADEITFYPSIGTYGAFVQSVVAGNTNNVPYINGAINSAYWSEVVNFNTVTEEYFQQVQAAVAQAESAASEAESSAQAAGGSATQSAGSAAEAAQSAQAAQTSAEAAQVWEERAANFSENAENSKNTASEYVSEAHNAADAAYTAMQSAQSSATEAQGYAEYTKQLVDGLGGVYIPQGSLAFASLPAQPAAQYQGYVWNITDAFTTDSRFLEGAGESVPAGANVACVLVDGAYKYDVLSGIVDLSNYAQINGTYSGMTVGKATNADNATKATQDASGNVITATYATKTENNAKYTKPSTGIPKTDLASAVQASLGKADSAYQKPSTGIPKGDLESSVQTSLSKADSALQSIPIATPSVVGGVKTIQKTADMTQTVGIDGQGVLWTKEASEGTTVVANPTATGTQDLTSLQVGGTVYNIPQQGGIVFVSSLPTPTQIEYEKHLLYLQGTSLNYLVAELATEPTVETVAALPNPKAGGSSATVGTDCYIFCGRTDSRYSSVTNQIVKFDTISQTVTTLNATLGRSLAHISSAAVDTNCYTFGGQGANSYNVFKSIYKFDTISQTSTSLPNLPVFLMDSSAVSVGTNCYIFGGREGDGNSDSKYSYIQKFDTVQQTATILTTRLPSVRYNTSSAAVGTNCYIFGGYTGSSFLDQIIKFDTVTQTITTLSTKLPSARRLSGAASVGTNCYVFGGFGSNSRALSDIIKFDTVTQTITTLSKTLPSAIYGINVQSVGTNCYILGGDDFSKNIVKVSFGYTYNYKTLLNQGDISYETV